MEIQRKRNWTMIVMSTLFVCGLLIAGGAIGFVLYQRAHSQQTQSPTTPGGSVSLDSTPKIETEDLEAALVIPASTNKAGDSIKMSILNLTAPKSWRAINAKNLMNTSLQNVYAESASDILAQFALVPESNPIDKTLAINSLSLYNITAWLAKPSTGNTTTVTPAMKAAYIANIQNLADDKPNNKDACKNSAGVLNVAICDDLLKPQSLASRTGQFKGVAYLGTIGQAATYDPVAFVTMIGTVKDQTILVYGAFHLLDLQSHQLDTKDQQAVKAAWEAFKKGDIPNDTMSLYQHVVDAAKSISIQD